MTDLDKLLTECFCVPNNGGMKDITEQFDGETADRHNKMALFDALFTELFQYNKQYNIAPDLNMYSYKVHEAINQEISYRTKDGLFVGQIPLDETRWETIMSYQK